MKKTKIWKFQFFNKISACLLRHLLTLKVGLKKTPLSLDLSLTKLVAKCFYIRCLCSSDFSYNFVFLVDMIV